MERSIDEELLAACKIGSEDQVKRLIKEGAYPDYYDILHQGKTPLHIAVRYGHEAIVSTLLSLGANPNAKDELERTPLHEAASVDSEPSILALISNGANPNSKTTSGRTPLHAAAARGHDSSISVLISYGANVHVTDHSRRTPLHVAASKGHDCSISVLLSYGANIHVTDCTGRAPLHDAASSGFESSILAMISNGADPNLITDSLVTISKSVEKTAHGTRIWKGRTPLHEAALIGSDVIISALLSHGANPNVADISGFTPLHEAVSRGYESATLVLLSNGADPNMADNSGCTPIHLAAMDASVKITQLLLKHGSLIVQNKKGKTAIEIAEDCRNKKVSNFYKKLLGSGLPKELLYLTTEDSAKFTDNLKSGFYMSYTGKVMCVGHQAVGKTAIITNLKGLKPSPIRKATEGLDLHIYKAAINMETKQWVCKELDLEDVAFRDLLSKPKILEMELNNITEDDGENNEKIENDDACQEKMEDKRLAESKHETQEFSTPKTVTSRRGSLFKTIKQKLGYKKADIRTAEEILKEAIRRGKDGLINSSFAPINMMDFGGQTAFYSTHQSFLSYRGVYILVIDGSKDFDEEIDSEMFIPGFHGKPTSRIFTLFWVGSIESCSKGRSDGFPKILVVCTHKDKVPKEEADQKVEQIFTEIEDMFKGTSAMKHLVLEHRIFLNAMSPEDPGYEQLKNVLVELVCNQPTWGEKLPKPWIHLKMMINRAVEKGKTIMTMSALEDINRENPVQVLSDKDLQLFLKMLHAQGEIIYFPLAELRDYIVISPAFLVDALRSLVTDLSFCSGHRYETLVSINQNGLLRQKDIDIIWKNRKKVLQHKQFLLKLLKHLDVTAVPRNYDKDGEHKTPDFYYVPSLVSVTDDTNYFKACESRALGISFRFASKILPPAIGYRLIASCVDMFEIQKYNGRLMLFSGMVVLNLKKGLDIAVFLRPERVDLFLLHDVSRVHIVRDTAAGMKECLNDILKSILENYKASTSETEGIPDIPFTVEYPCFNCSTPCYTNKTEERTCTHGCKMTKDVFDVWKIDKMIESCSSECTGLGETDLAQCPSELHLAKFAQQFHWMDLYQFLIRLGLKDAEIKAIQTDYGENQLNVAFLCLRKWRMKTNHTIGKLVDVLREMEVDIHSACKMLRNRPMDSGTAKLSMKEPTDKLLDSIASEAIIESLFLSIELDHKASVWLEMKNDREKIVKINRKLLGDWRSKHPRKDQMKHLEQALCNVGLNITTFVQDI